MMLETESKEAPAAKSNQAQVTAGHVSTNTLQVPGGASVSPPVASIHSHSPAPPATEDEDESEDESDILEESPCGHWLKRSEEVKLRIIPRMDSASLGVDTKDGFEVVWSEVLFSRGKHFNLLQDRVKAVFERLVDLDHPNIVQCFQYWAEIEGPWKRLIFITEHPSHGNLKKYRKQTSRVPSKINTTIWKKWCTQVLSALSYLHSCNPPIIHGDLSWDTIFLQPNRVIKIGSVARDTIEHHIKTCPQYRAVEDVSTAVEITAFGIFALEMALLEIEGDREACDSQEAINSGIALLKDPLQRELIQKCLEPNPRRRPTARELMFHQALFEVPRLKLLAAHCVVCHPHLIPENALEDMTKNLDPNLVIAEIKEGDPLKLSQFPVSDLCEFLEDVRNGAHPMTVFEVPCPQQNAEPVE